VNEQSIVILVPAFNAGGSLPILLKALDQHVDRAQVVIVDDGSREETAAVLADSGVTVLRHERNRGKGAALRTGFEYLKGRRGWEGLVTMDADLQHLPEDLPRFVERWKHGGADIVLGTRTRLGKGMPVHRVLSNTVTSFLVSARCGALVRDSQCGYRLLSRRVVEHVRFDSDGYEAETEILVRALLMGFKADAVPIRTVYGNERSHMRPWQTTKRFVAVLFWDY
jgi:glycosyltransferase involved in cell wall biosynthesis